MRLKPVQQQAGHSQCSVESRDVPENIYGSAPYAINVLQKQYFTKSSCSSIPLCPSKRRDLGGRKVVFS